MKTIAISLNYRGIKYISDFKKFNAQEEKKLKEFCEQVAKSNSICLEFNKGNKVFFFPKGILEESIITLIYK